jgi:hypothetical protein
METDEQFLKRMRVKWQSLTGQYAQDTKRIADLAERGAAAIEHDRLLDEMIAQDLEQLTALATPETKHE